MQSRACIISVHQAVQVYDLPYLQISLSAVNAYRHATLLSFATQHSVCRNLCGGSLLSMQLETSLSMVQLARVLHAAGESGLWKISNPRLASSYLTSSRISIQMSSFPPLNRAPWSSHFGWIQPHTQNPSCSHSHAFQPSQGPGRLNILACKCVYSIVGMCGVWYALCWPSCWIR